MDSTDICFVRVSLMSNTLCFRLRLFQKFDLFRILVCGGDGSIGWVLAEIDKLGLQKQVKSNNYFLLILLPTDPKLFVVYADFHVSLPRI